MPAYREFYYRKLPHWQPANATLFVTFRLAGSLPRGVIEELNAAREKERFASEHQADLKVRQIQIDEDERLAFGRWDAALGQAGAGPYWLRQPAIASMVAEAFHYRDRRQYHLISYCIMPNHVHAVFTPLFKTDGEFYGLDGILHSLKRHTAREANAILGRRGAFWQAGSYDHVVRNNDELRRIVDYVVQNPVRAGLSSSWQEWPWTFVRSVDEWVIT